MIVLACKQVIMSMRENLSQPDFVYRRLGNVDWENKDLKDHNIAIIKALGKPIARVDTLHNCAEAVKSKLSSNQDSGLLKQMLLCKGMEVMLVKTNLFNAAGLTNSARGAITYILYKSGDNPLAVPHAVVVHFPHYRRPSFLANEPGCVWTVPVTKSWVQGIKPCMRTILPPVPYIKVKEQH